MRVLLHYISAFFLMAIYGGQVCPFLESLSFAQLTAPIGVALTVQFFCRKPLFKFFVDNASFALQARRVFQVEFSLFIVFSLFVAIFNTLVYGFPIGSGLKLVLGLSTLGLFASIDLALQKELFLAHHFRETGKSINPRGAYFSLPKKVAYFAAGCVLFFVADIFLVINKDLDWMVMLGGQVTFAEARGAILLEVSFVAVVLLAHLLNLIRSYATKMDHFFQHENNVLHSATGGDFDQRVPVSTSDEFGVMAEQTNLMVEGLQESTAELRRTRDVTILTLASLAETRDNETGAHILRTQRYVRALAEYLRDKPGYQEYLDEETVDLLFKSAPLHDIGKVGIPDRILLKPGKLTDDEFEVMKTHTTLGGDALEEGERRLGGSSFLGLAREIAYTHHEKWDGSGYPYGLKGDDLPISGRLMAVADVYDALISKRVYKDAFSHQKAMEIISEGNGSHFDPGVIDCLLAVEREFIAIAEKYGDSG